MKSIRETAGEVTNFFSYSVFLERIVAFCFFPTRFFVCLHREMHYYGMGIGKQKRNSRVEEFSRGFQCKGGGCHVTENEILSV